MRFQTASLSNAAFKPLDASVLYHEARRQAILDAEKAKAPAKPTTWKGMFDRRGHNRKVKGSENRKTVNRNVLNFLDKGAADKEEASGLLSVVANPRPPSAKRTALYSAVLAQNAEVGEGRGEGFGRGGLGWDWRFFNLTGAGAVCYTIFIFFATCSASIGAGTCTRLFLVQS